MDHLMETTDDPVGALDELLSKVKISHGIQGVNYILNHIQSKISPSPESSLSAAYEILDTVLSEPSLLQSQGREDIIKHAFEDGSTSYCKNCKGMIKKERWAQHVEYWCPGIEVGDDDT
ncbi:hypothetical protein TrLO_g15305 [Triparma laevis f. longispina]|uniref:C2HC zinc finger plants domain-containing protein n=1 Tax=Triparma laevis f. longispina TaxID=1714387 RepID=A0A9W7FRV4_9STRA|nr:hypothetical protein TrLO_g15305 [Triparma laevis f. longispina]